MNGAPEDEWGRPPDITAAYLVEREAQTEDVCTSLMSVRRKPLFFKVPSPSVAPIRIEPHAGRQYAGSDIPRRCQ